MFHVSFCPTSPSINLFCFLFVSFLVLKAVFIWLYSHLYTFSYKLKLCTLPCLLCKEQCICVYLYNIWQSFVESNKQVKSNLMKSISTINIERNILILLYDICLLFGSVGVIIDLISYKTLLNISLTILHSFPMLCFVMFIPMYTQRWNISRRQHSQAQIQSQSTGRWKTQRERSRKFKLGAPLLK